RYQLLWSEALMIGGAGIAWPLAGAVITLSLIVWSPMGALPCCRTGGRSATGLSVTGISLLYFGLCSCMIRAVGHSGRPFSFRPVLLESYRMNRSVGTIRSISISVALFVHCCPMSLI